MASGSWTLFIHNLSDGPSSAMVHSQLKIVSKSSESIWPESVIRPGRGIGRSAHQDIRSYILRVDISMSSINVVWHVY